MTPTPDRLRHAYADLYVADPALIRLLGDLDALYATPEPPAQLRDGFARLLARREQAPRAVAHAVEAGGERELPARRGVSATSGDLGPPTRPRWLRQSAALVGALLLFGLLGGLLALVFRDGDTRPQLAASPASVLASPTVVGTAPTSTPQPTAPPATPLAGFTPVTQADGQCIAFSRLYVPPDLFVMAADGSQLRQFELDDFQLASGVEAWSPDGQFIAFGGSHGSQFGIYVMRADGSDMHALIEGVAASNVLAWSPDGSQLAFTQQPPGPSASQIYVIDSDGSNLRALTDSIGYNENPSWSPDGRQIVFDSDRAGNHDLYSMNADGSDQRNLTNDPARDYAYRWLPDGRIVFSSDRAGGGWFTMNADGSDVRPLTILRPDDYAPDWSPDGSLIAFGNGGDIYVMRADGTQRRNLTVYPTSSNAPHWSPDGQQILFENIRNEYQLPPANSAGVPKPIILSASGVQQAGGAGAYCWNQGGSGRASDWIGVSMPETPITLTSAGAQLNDITLEVSPVGAPTAIAVEVYDYAAATARNRIINGAFVAPCAAPGGTEDGCVVRRVNAPATAVTQALVDLPPGEYLLVVSAAFAGDGYSGYTRQGFHVVVSAAAR